MLKFANGLLLFAMVFACIGCGNSEADKVAAEKKKVRVNWNEKSQQADDWWANESPKTRESQTEYIAEREEDRADADQDRPLSERRRRRRAAKFASDEQQASEESSGEQASYEEEPARKRLTDEISEETE